MTEYCQAVDVCPDTMIVLSNCCERIHMCCRVGLT